jgi:hypothetical protein
MHWQLEAQGAPHSGLAVEADACTVMAEWQLASSCCMRVRVWSAGQLPCMVTHLATPGVGGGGGLLCQCYTWRPRRPSACWFALGPVAAAVGALAPLSCGWLPLVPSLRGQLGAAGGGGASVLQWRPSRLPALMLSALPTSLAACVRVTCVSRGWLQEEGAP